jgi:DNA-binding XRE family transcriptional regulator
LTHSIVQGRYHAPERRNWLASQSEGSDVSELDSGIGARVQAARQRRGWSRDALAYHSGISSSAIAQIESGRRRKLRPATVTALASALNLSADYLMGGGPSRPIFEHLAYFYDTDDAFLATVGSVLEGGAEAGDGMLVLATDVKIEMLREHLGAAADPVEFVDSTAWLTSLAGALVAFREFSARKLEAGATWVRIVGDPSSGLRDAEIERWLRLEALANLAFSGWPLTMVCPYDRRSVADDVITRAARAHPRVLDDAGPSESPDYADPGGLILGP